MLLAHYSKDPLKKINRISLKPRLDGMKPSGLWVSVDDTDQNWQDWSVGESFALDRFKFRTAVTFTPEARILYINTEEELRAFHKEYALPLYPNAPERSEVIDWFRLAKTHDGVIISPYQWGCRLDFAIWYYAWDCASGCIWNHKVIQLGESEFFDIDVYAKQRESSAA